MSTFLNRIKHGMSSGPFDFFIDSFFVALIVSSSVQGCRNKDSGGSPLRKESGSVSVCGIVAACVVPTLL